MSRSVRMPSSSPASLSFLTPPRIRALPVTLWSLESRTSASTPEPCWETPDGLPLGTVCVLDYKARELDRGTGVHSPRAGKAGDGSARAAADRGQYKRPNCSSSFSFGSYITGSKNTLATVQSIMGSTARASSTMEEFQNAFTGRVISLAKTHSLLTEERWQTVPLHDLVCLELEPTMTRPASGSRSEGRKWSSCRKWPFQSAWPFMR